MGALQGLSEIQEGGLMPITPEYFTEKFEKTKLLMGWNMPFKRIEVIYDRCMQYHPNDLMLSLRAMEDEDMFKTKIFMNHMNTARSKREEAEGIRQRDREDRESKKFMSSASSKPSTRCERPVPCDECTKQFCHEMAYDSMMGIRRITSGQIDVEKFNSVMARSYPGAGWEA